MAVTLLHQGATVLCQHGGQAGPISVIDRVKVSGKPITVQSIPYQISGCSNNSLLTGGPCVLGQWVTSARQLKVNNIPVLLSNSSAVCIAPGTGLSIINTQQRVTGK